MPAIPLSHACIVTDKLPADSPLRQAQDTALGRGSTASEHVTTLPKRLSKVESLLVFVYCAPPEVTINFSYIGCYSSNAFFTLCK